MKRNTSRRLLLLSVLPSALLLLVFSSPTAAFAVEANAVQAVEAGNGTLRAELIADAGDGTLDRFTLWQAALIAGRDLDRRRFEKACSQFESILAESARLPRDPRQRFEFMHREVLTGEYRSGQNDMNRLLDSGDYNCVTATILYQALSSAAGESTVAIAAPAHVFCRLNGSALGDIETTCPTWFSESTRRETPRSGRTITAVQLIGKIFYNRGVQLLEHEQFAAALEQLEISLQFDAHDPTAHANRLAALNNWALFESNAKRFPEAVQLIARGRALDPGYSPLLANDLHVHQQWVHHLCQQHREAEAIELLLARRVERPEQPLYRDGPLAVYRMWLQRLAGGDDWTFESQSLAEIRSRLKPHQAAAEERAILGRTVSLGE